jgi:hypothetical protein
LPEDKDFNAHSAELLINELPIGHYMVMIANNKDFDYNKKLVAYDFVNITNLSYVQRTLKNGDIEFYVLNRKTGEPLNGVTVQTWKEKYSYIFRRYKKVKYKKYTSNEKGYVRITTPDKHYIKFICTFAHINFMI